MTKGPLRGWECDRIYVILEEGAWVKMSMYLLNSLQKMQVEDKYELNILGWWVNTESRTFNIFLLIKSNLEAVTCEEDHSSQVCWVKYITIDDRVEPVSTVLILVAHGSHWASQIVVIVVKLILSVILQEELPFSLTKAKESALLWESLLKIEHIVIFMLCLRLNTGAH